MTKTERLRVAREIKEAYNQAVARKKYFIDAKGLLVDVKV